MAKTYGNKIFTAYFNGELYCFDCWTTDTRNGFCHHAECYKLGISARIGYCNRTWESFRYESVLRNCIDKLSRKADKELHDALIGELIEGESKREKEMCDSMLNAFQSAWNGASEGTRERVRNVVGENGVESEGEMRGVTAMVQLANLMER